MPHTPRQAPFLTEMEKQVAVDRMAKDSHHAESGVVDEERFDWHWVRMAFSSPNTWLASIAWFFLLIPLYVGASTKIVFRQELIMMLELFPVPSDPHQGSRLYVHQGPTVLSSTKHGRFRLRPDRGSIIGQVENARTFPAWWMFCRHHRICYASGIKG